VRFQKLTRNLFLTLHGHNVHRQQQQLSKFLIRYQQFASHAYCGAAGPVSKMALQQEKAFCVLRFEVSRSVITVQREFRARFRKDAPFFCVYPVLLLHNLQCFVILVKMVLEQGMIRAFVDIYSNYCEKV